MSTQPAPTAPVPAEHPRCQEHPESIATGTCERCGRFVCDECMEDRRVCSACVAQRLRSLPSSSGRAFWASLFLGGHMLVDGAAGLVSLLELGTGRSEALAIVTGFIGLGMLGMWPGSVIAFLMWQHLAVRQAEALAVQVGTTPGGAVGAWFIPFINLVKPYRTVRNLVGGLGGERLIGSTHVGLWWGLWIASRVLNRIELPVHVRVGPGGEMVVPPEVHLFWMLTGLTSVGAAWLCIGVVRAVQRELDSRRQ